MTAKSRLDGLEKQMKAATAELRRRGRLATPIVYVNEPEGDHLEEFRLPQWVLDSGITIEIGRPAGATEPETQAEWVERLGREAEWAIKAPNKG